MTVKVVKVGDRERADGPDILKAMDIRSIRIRLLYVPGGNGPLCSHWQVRCVLANELMTENLVKGRPTQISTQCFDSTFKQIPLLLPPQR